MPFDKAVAPAIAAKTEQVWLQTSEGVGTQPKVQAVAEFLSQEPAAHADAHPAAKPVELPLTRRQFGTCGTIAWAACPAASSRPVGKSPSRIVSAVAAASPPHSSAPWRSGRSVGRRSRA